MKAIEVEGLEIDIEVFKRLRFERHAPTTDSYYFINSYDRAAFLYYRNLPFTYVYLTWVGKDNWEVEGCLGRDVRWERFSSYLPAFIRFMELLGPMKTSPQGVIPL